jgi:ankyrin repeat protein
MIEKLPQPESIRTSRTRRRNCTDTASRTGNVDAVTLLLVRGANVNAKESGRGQTALMWAVLENHADAVKLLLARGADINAKTTARTIKGEYTPARPAAASGPGIIRQRALPTTDGGMTASAAAARARLPVTRLLLDSGADMQLASANDTSPLIIAILNGQIEIASYLLNRGANPNAIDAYKRGPLFAAIELRNFNHEKYSDLPTDGREPLDLIKALLAKGANPNQQTNTTPVHGLMQFDGSWVNFDGQTPLIRAALSGDAEVMKLLLQYKADAKITTDGGTTSLMAAAGIIGFPRRLHAFRGRIRRGREFVPRAGR